MSIHKSLKPKEKLKRQRNVLTRRERVKKLMEQDQFDEDEDSVFGLPKLKKARSTPAVETAESDESTESEDTETTDDAGSEDVSDDNA